MKTSFWNQLKVFWNTELVVGDEFYASDLLETLTVRNKLLDKVEIKKLRSNLSSYLIRLEKKGQVKVTRTAGSLNCYEKLLDDSSGSPGRPSDKRKAAKAEIPTNLPNKLDADFSSLQVGESIITVILNLRKRLDAKDVEIKALKGEVKDQVELNTDYVRQIRKCKQKILDLNNQQFRKNGRSINLHQLQEAIGGK